MIVRDFKQEKNVNCNKIFSHVAKYATCEKTYSVCTCCNIYSCYETNGLNYRNFLLSSIREDLYDTTYWLWEESSKEAGL